MAIALQAWPFENVDTTEQQYGRLFRLFQEDGFNDQPTSGVGAVTAGTGFTLNVAAFPLAYAAGVAASLSSAGTVTLDSAGAQSRVDRVVIRVNSSTNIATVDKITGVPGATQAPALTQSPGGVYEIPLARVAIPPNALNVASSNITDERTFTSRRIIQYTAPARPAGSKGDFGFNHTTGLPEYHDGTSWGPISRTATDASALSSGTLPRDRYGADDVLRAARDNRFYAPMSGGNAGIVDGDWNAVLGIGMYRIFAGATNTNSPPNAYLYGTLVVFGAGPQIESRTQVYYEHSGSRAYWRTAWNGNDWQGWFTAAGTGDVNALRADHDGAINQDRGRLAALESTTTTGFTVSNGWAVNRANFWNAGRVLTMDLSLKRTGGNVGSGNITNIRLGDIAGGFGSAGYISLTSGPGGPTASGYVQGTGVWLAATTAGIATNAELTLGGTWVRS